MKTLKNLLALLGVVALCGLLGVACGDDSASSDGSAMNDMAVSKPDLTTGENPDLAPACVSMPMTHVEIINACTNADSYDKMPFYPTLAPNGTLPPLP